MSPWGGWEDLPRKVTLKLGSENLRMSYLTRGWEGAECWGEAQVKSKGDPEWVRGTEKIHAGVRKGKGERGRERAHRGVGLELTG